MKNGVRLGVWVFKNLKFAELVMKQVDSSFSPHYNRSEYERFVYRGIGQELEVDFKKGNQKGLDVLGSDCFTERLIMEKPKLQHYQVCTRDLAEVV